MTLSLLRVIGMLLIFYIGIVALLYFRQRSLLYFPSHLTVRSALDPWLDGNQTIGFCREVPHPHAIWLMMHGNAGQAADRDYVLPCLSPRDSLFVLEYPGYGSRYGSPSMDSMNRAASQAYQLLRARYPGVSVCVLGESIGSGPACSLVREKIMPDKIVLVVPFDTLASVASAHFFFLPVRLMLRDTWDNVRALKYYTGPVEIFGAKQDTIIPIEHAKNLARQIPNAEFTAISGGHNEWAYDGKVRIGR